MTGLGECSICLVALALPIAGGVLPVRLVRGTKQPPTGVNLEGATTCPTRGTALPAVRAPKRVRQRS